MNINCVLTVFSPVSATVRWKLCSECLRTMLLLEICCCWYFASEVFGPSNIHDAKLAYCHLADCIRDYGPLYTHSGHSPLKGTIG